MFLSFYDLLDGLRFHSIPSSFDSSASGPSPYISAQALLLGCRNIHAPPVISHSHPWYSSVTFAALHPIFLFSFPCCPQRPQDHCHSADYYAGKKFNHCYHLSISNLSFICAGYKSTSGRLLPVHRRPPHSPTHFHPAAFRLVPFSVSRI